MVRVRRPAGARLLKALSSAPGYAAFLIAMAITSWLALAYFLATPGGWPRLSLSWSLGLFIALVGGVRTFAFPLRAGDSESEVSMDSAIFIAAAACVGEKATAAGIALLLTIDTLIRNRRTKRPLLSLLRSLYYGGFSGALLLLWAHVLGVGLVVPTGHVTIALWKIPVFGLLFVASHYCVQTIELRLQGEPLAAALRRNALGVLAEATLLPLATAMVHIWHPNETVAFTLLGATYLLVNYGFEQLAQLAQKLRRRVAELETLQRTGVAVAGSLDAPQLLGSLLQETANSMPLCSRLEAVLEPTPAGGKIIQHVWRKESALAERGELDATPAWLQGSTATLTHDVIDVERSGVRARIVVPLVMYGERIGAIGAETAIKEGFGVDEMRLLKAIAHQAAAAVENARLYTLANVDGLTGLYCRRYFDIRVAEEIERARRFGTSFALIMLDIDDFKKLNDSRGHVAGDRALKAVARLAQNQLRHVDLAARYGGEELAFLLPRTTLVDAQSVATRIREAIATHIHTEGSARFAVTASLGVAGWAESGGMDPQGMVARADAALYRAKGAGKNRVDVDLTSFELTPSLGPVRRLDRA